MFDNICSRCQKRFNGIPYFINHIPVCRRCLKKEDWLNELNSEYKYDKIQEYP